MLAQTPSPAAPCASLLRLPRPAISLFLSEATVKTHVGHLLGWLGSGVVAWAVLPGGFDTGTIIPLLIGALFLADDWFKKGPHGRGREIMSE